MLKTVFLVPMRDNDGKPFSPEIWRELERRLLHFGGYSVETGIRGAWEHQGRVYRDVSHRYTVSLTSWTDIPRWLEVVRWAQVNFRQKAIFIEVAGITEIIGTEEQL